MRWLVMLLGIVLSNVTAWAVEQSDFAYGYRLETPEAGAIYTLAIPEAVYRGITRADRGDLRVLNSSAVPVPHALRLPEQQPTPDQALPYFPLYKVVVNSEPNIRITTNPQGTIVAVEHAPGDTASGHPTAYIVDASAAPQRLRALTFVWPETHTPFVLTVRLDSSDDLHQWRPLLRGAVLSHLRYGEHRLLQQHLELPTSTAKYLRLTWEGSTPVTLERVIAHFAGTLQEQPRQWTAVVATHYDKNHHWYVFDSQAYFPTDRVRVQLPQRNSLIRAAIDCSSSQDGPWQTLYRGILYDLEVENTRLSTPPLSMNIRRERYWRLHLLEAEQQLGGMPTLELGWVPEQLVFVAQGSAPFTLAYGSGRIGPTAAPLAELLREETLQHQGKLIKTAYPGAAIALGERTVLQHARPVVPWKQAILWTVLVLGVLVLALLTLRLYKQMQRDNVDTTTTDERGATSTPPQTPSSGTNSP